MVTHDKAFKLLARIHVAACNWLPDTHHVALTFFDYDYSIDEAIKMCLGWQAEHTFESPALRELRDQLFDDVLVTQYEGYAEGRFLLSSAVGPKPAYSKPHVEAARNATMIRGVRPKLGTEALLRTLNGGNRVMISYLEALAKGNSIAAAVSGVGSYLALYMFGLGCAMSEEALFGPLM